MDSVVLVHLLSKSGHKIELAHVNYGLRGEESEKDEQFVRELAERLDVPLHVLHAEDPKSIQTWAREVRYDWFQKLSLAMGIRYVAVAHHEDDQLETMLLNLLRGTGLSGLSGMRPWRPLNAECCLLRPLLGTRIAQIQAYAQSNGLSWREDKSNKEGPYARTEIRNELKQMSVVDYEAFLKAGMGLQKTISNIREKIAQACFGAETGSRVSLYSLRLEDWESAPRWAQGWIVLEILQRMDAMAPRRESVVRVIEALAEAETGKKANFGRIEIWKEKDRLEFVRARGSVSETNFEPLGHEVTLPEGAFTLSLPSGLLVGDVVLQASPERIVRHPREAFLDADKLNHPLILRKWRPGDRFSPLGLDGSQKVKSFLTNQKVPSRQRKDAQILLSEGKVVWVVGMRIDDAFKVSDQTKRTLNLKWLPTLPQ